MNKSANSADVRQITRPSQKAWKSLIPGGYTSTGEILYIGRKIHEGEMTPGKILPSHNCLYISYGDEEHCYKDNYEVLVSRVRLDCEWFGEKKMKNGRNL